MMCRGWIWYVGFGAVMRNGGECWGLQNGVYVVSCVFNHERSEKFQMTDMKGMNNFLPDAPAVPDSGRWKPVQRGFPEGTELLTELGWLDFRVLYSDEYLGKPIPFVGNGYNLPGYEMKNTEWGQWETKPVFPKVASVNPVTGAIMFVQPTGFVYYLYDSRLIHLKMKGVDVLTTLFSDWWLKPRYGRSWKFVLGDDVVRTNYGPAHYGLLNKFNEDMYGWWSPEKFLTGDTMLTGLQGERIPVVGSSLKVNVDAPILVYPKKHVKRKRVWDFFNYDTVDRLTGEVVSADRVRVDVPVFNVLVEPFHNIIVRRGRKDENPRTLWVGGPVVFGDGLDKSLLRVGGVLGAAAGGGSYSPLRPGNRNNIGSGLKK